MTKVETDALCSLCGLDCGIRPLHDQVDGATLPFCCSGCLNVHAILRASGVLKSGVDPRETELFQRSLALGLISTREAPKSVEAPAASRERLLRVSGMWCGACAWLIEHTLRKERGIALAEVYFASDLLKVQYDPRFVPPGHIKSRLRSLGYDASEYQQDSAAAETERKDLLLRFGVAAFLWINVMLLNFSVYAGHFGGMPVELRPYLPFVVMGLASPVVLYSAKPVFRLAWRGLLNGAIRMEALLSLGILSAYGYSSVQAFRGSNHLYFDIACGITVLVLVGKWVERNAKERTAAAVAGLYEMMPRKARVLDNHQQERFVAIDALKSGDIIVVKAGERIPADGVVVNGESHADESLLTGESSPVAKKEGAAVTGGSVNGGGILHVRATAVGENSVLAQILRSVEHSLGRRSEVERNADRAARSMVPVIILFAVAVGLLSGDLMRAVTILVIACPCALGIATPLALTAAVGAASRRGILVSDARVLETVRQLDVMIMDKTGTVTEGRFELLEANDQDLPAIAAVERFSEHPLGLAVLARFKGSIPEATDIQVHAGLGISGVVHGRRLFVGNRRLFDGAPEEHVERRTSVYYGWDRIVGGRLVFGDRVRPEAVQLVRSLRMRGISTIIVSGDAVGATRWASEQVAADEFRAEVLPDGKAEIIAELQATGKIVAMAGDGINDAPALARANLGIAMGGGTDLAMKAATIVLMKNDLGRVIEMLDLPRRTLRIVKQNLFWAFAYNFIGLVMASLGMLNPIIASGAMVISSACVTANALRLRRMAGYP
jgi:heavy metal translocating P-type ATPase